MKLRLYFILSIVFSDCIFAGFNFGSKNSVLSLKTSNSSLSVNSPISGYKGTLSIEVPAAGSVVSTGPVNLLTFAGGVLTTGQNSYTLTGTYDGTTTDVINLGAGDVLDIASGSVVQAVVVKGTSGSPSVIRGQPIFSQVITINDATSYLNLQLQNYLSQNIALNSGVVNLSGDLAFASGNFFTGNGTVNINNFKLTMPPNPTTAWTNTLTFQNAKTIELSGYTKLSGTWNFSDPAGISFINGNGNVLDLTGGGTLQVASNHTLFIENTIIKGLGAANGAFSLNVVNGTVKLANVALELMANYTLSSGQIYINGPNCKLIYAQNTNAAYTFAVTSTGTLTVDHEAFEYDSLSVQPNYPFTFTSQSTQLNVINSGVIRALSSGTSQALIIDQAASSPALTSNIFLSSSTPFNLTNVGATVASMSVNGNGYSIFFPTSGSGYLTLGNTLTANFTNTTFKDFNPNLITYGTSSVINFGAGCLIQLAQDLTLNSGAKALTFNGSATLDACGKNIYVSAASKIAISGGSTLTIKNANIYLTSATGLSCAVAGDKILFSNCNIYVGAAGLTFATGNIDIDGTVVFQGCNETTAGGSAAFTYTSGGAFRVLTDSTLKFLGNINFTYQANPTTNSDTYVQSKRHLRMIDPSASIIFSGSTLTTTTTGLAFDYGNLIFEDRVAVNVNTGAGAQLDVGSGLNFFLRSGATVEIDGPVNYNTTTFP